jgi:hypothetical protein
MFRPSLATLRVPRVRALNPPILGSVARHSRRMDITYFKFLTQSLERAPNMRLHCAQGEVRFGRNVLVTQLVEKSERQ